MIDSLQRNWGKALSEVSASMVGALGFIFLVALALSGQDANVELGNAFFGYFGGGQIGLSILSVSGVAFIALLRHRPTPQLLNVLLFVLFIGPIVATAFIIGMNPGFYPGRLSATILFWLWLLFFGLHILWFFILLLEPTIPSAQEAGETQETRVKNIKPGASSHAQ